MADLTDIKGLGPAKVEKLKAAGIHDVRALAELDLRKRTDIPIGNDILKRAKTQARRLLTEEGKGFAKATYGDAPATAPAAKKGSAKGASKTARKASSTPRSSGKAAGKATATSSKTAAAKGAGKKAQTPTTKASPAPSSHKEPAASPAATGKKAPKKGLWSRILRR